MEIIKSDIQNYYSGKKILITGGNGYLGSNLINRLSEFECQISSLDKSISNIEKVIAEKAKFKSITCDITDSGIWQNILDGIDIVFHFAGQTSVYVANEDPINDFKINVSPLLSILETCRKNKYNPDILFASTATVFGIPQKLPVSEFHADKPITVYDLHKQMAEGYLKYYSNAGIVKGAILRLANVYGPGVKNSSADRGILNLMINKALKSEDLTLYGKGDNIRDYIFVDDVITAFLLSGININKMNGGHYITATGNGCSLYEAFNKVLNSVHNLTNNKVNLISIDPPNSISPIESRDFIADVSLLKKSIGWFPNITLEDGINKTVKYYGNLANE